MFRRSNHSVHPVYADRCVDSPSAIKAPSRSTQEEQDEVDEEARRQALKDLISSWNDRFQLISLITTFFASVEAGMLQTTTPSNRNDSPGWLSACNAALLSGLIMHANASFVSFIAAFFLISFKVRVAKKEEQIARGEQPHSQHREPGSIIIDMAEKHIATPPTDPQPGPLKIQPTNTSTPPVWSRNPHLVQMGPFSREPPIGLLSRLHSFCIFTSIAGFILAVTGIVCYAWAMQPLSVSILTTVSTGLVLGGGFFTLVYRSDGDSMYIS